MRAAVYARSAARPRPSARRARVEPETFEPSVCGLSRVFVLPPARPLFVRWVWCVGVWGGVTSLASRACGVPPSVPAPVSGLVPCLSTQRFRLALWIQLHFT